MGDFRARDADRERYVDVIESAYVDGQLGEQDRELRVGRALTAETLDELDSLTRDLQNQPAPVVVHRTPAPTVVPPAPVTPRPVPSPVDRRPAKGFAFAAAVIFAIVVYAMVVPAPDETFADRTDFATIPWDQIETAPEVSYQLSAPGVNTFVRRYRAKFDTSEAHEVAFLSHRVSVHVPVGGSRSQVEVWTWDGDWRRDAKAQSADGPTDLVDLRTLDVRALFENADVAKLELNVSDAELARVAVRPTPDGQGRVTIHVRNSSTDSGFLETTPQGSRIRAVPHEG